MFQLPSFVSSNFNLQEEVKTAIVSVVNGMYVPYDIIVDQMS
jgi:hypothetical protein